MVGLFNSKLLLGQTGSMHRMYLFSPSEREKKKKEVFFLFKMLQKVQNMVRRFQKIYSMLVKHVTSRLLGVWEHTEVMQHAGVRI